MYELRVLYAPEVQRVLNQITEHLNNVNDVIEGLFNKLSTESGDVYVQMCLDLDKLENIKYHLEELDKNIRKVAIPIFIDFIIDKENS